MLFFFSALGSGSGRLGSRPSDLGPGFCSEGVGALFLRRRRISLIQPNLFQGAGGYWFQSADQRKALISKREEHSVQTKMWALMH